MEAHPTAEKATNFLQDLSNKSPSSPVWYFKVGQHLTATKDCCLAENECQILINGKLSSANGELEKIKNFNKPQSLPSELMVFLFVHFRCLTNEIAIQRMVEAMSLAYVPGQYLRELLTLRYLRPLICLENSNNWRADMIKVLPEIKQTPIPTIAIETRPSNFISLWSAWLAPVGISEILKNFTKLLPNTP